MDKLSIKELNTLRLAIFLNAESLHKEAKLLYENGHYARSFLLAHFACEELGKLPIIVGALGQLAKNEKVDWKKVMRRFRDHKTKVDSDDFHHYVFGIDLDLVNDADLKWLEAANAVSAERVQHKNHSTYVDIRESKIIAPLDAVSQKDANATIERAFNSLKAHWGSECLTNPLFQTAQKPTVSETVSESPSEQCKIQAS